MTEHKPRQATLDKKRKILEIALECFINHGVAGTTIDMIKALSGMSVGSLYHHFGNKDKIAAAVFIEGMRQFGQLARQYLSEVKAADGSAEEGVKALVYANIDWIEENPDWARFVFQHRSAVTSAGKENSLNSELKAFRYDLIEWFMPFVQKGVFRAMPMEILSAQITGPTHEYARHWLSGRYQQPLTTHKTTLAEAAWRAVKAD